jgi:hypothetical protein
MPVKRIAIKDPYFDLKWEIERLPENQRLKWGLMQEIKGDNLIFERIKVFWPKKIKRLEKVIDLLYKQMEKE